MKPLPKNRRHDFLTPLLTTNIFKALKFSCGQMEPAGLTLDPQDRQKQLEELNVTLSRMRVPPKARVQAQGMLLNLLARIA